MEAKRKKSEQKSLSAEEKKKKSEEARKRKAEEIKKEKLRKEAEFEALSQEEKAKKLKEMAVEEELKKTATRERDKKKETSKKKVEELQRLEFLVFVLGAQLDVPPARRTRPKRPSTRALPHEQQKPTRPRRDGRRKMMPAPTPSRLAEREALTREHVVRKRDRAANAKVAQPNSVTPTTRRWTNAVLASFFNVNGGWLAGKPFPTTNGVMHAVPIALATDAVAAHIVCRFVRERVAALHRRISFQKKKRRRMWRMRLARMPLKNGRAR